MNTPMPPNEREPLDRDERELADLYRQLPEARPGPELDARVLAEAERAVAPHARRHPRRWLLGVGSAAALVLAAGLAWQQRGDHPPAGTGAAEQRASAPASTTAPGPAGRGTLVPIHVDDNAEAKNTAPRIPLQERLQSTRPAVPQDRPAAAKPGATTQKAQADGMHPAKASRPSPAAAAVSAEDRAMPLAAPPPPPPPRVAEPVTSNAQTRLKIVGGVMEQAPPAPASATASLPELVQQAQAALKRHDVTTARRLALQIHTTYPDAHIPDDLAALLPASAASTGTP